MGLVSLAGVKKTLAKLHGANDEVHDALMTVVRGWSELQLEDGAGALLLQSATQHADSELRQELIRVLWHCETAVDATEVVQIYAAFDDEGRAALLRLLAERPQRSMSEALATLLITEHQAERLPDVRWPVLLPLEQRPRDADVIVPALLAVFRDDRWMGWATTTLYAYANVDALSDESRRLVGATIIPVIGRFLEQMTAAHGERDLHPSDAYRGWARKAGAQLDLLSLLCTAPGVPVLLGAAEHVDPWIALWGLVGCLRAGHDDLPAEWFEPVAASPRCRGRLAIALDDLGELERFPDTYWNQAAFAEGEMVEWLAYPTELNQPPDEIEPIKIFDVEYDGGPADLYVFKFRTFAPHKLADDGWMVGVSGPYPRSGGPSPFGMGATFSRFAKLDDMTVDEHVEHILGIQRE